MERRFWSCTLVPPNAEAGRFWGLLQIGDSSFVAPLNRLRESDAYGLRFSEWSASQSLRLAASIEQYHNMDFEEADMSWEEYAHGRYCAADVNARPVSLVVVDLALHSKWTILEPEYFNVKPHGPSLLGGYWITGISISNMLGAPTIGKPGRRLRIQHRHLRGVPPQTFSVTVYLPMELRRSPRLAANM